MPLLLNSLPDELVEAVLQHATSRDLALAGFSCQRLRLLGRAAALQHLRARAARPASWGSCNVILQLATLEQLEAAVGPRPRPGAPAWPAEYAPVMTEHMRCCRHYDQAEAALQNQWDADDEEWFDNYFRTDMTIERFLRENEAAVGTAVQRGMTAEHAEVYEVLSLAQPILFGPAPTHSASAYAIFDALSAMARLAYATGGVAPPLYSNLAGPWGLAEEDEAWRVLQQAEPPVGTRFVTRRTHNFDRASEENFPDGRCDGYYMCDDDVDEFRGADVVCVRSRPNDCGGRHSVLRDPGDCGTRKSPGAFVLPPFAVVELLSVQHKWKVRRQTMHCRLFTCVVSFDLW